MEREGGVQDYTKVADLRGWADGSPINIQNEISNLLEQRLGATTKSSVLLQFE